MSFFCYFNGKITTLDKVKISPYDLGLLRGYGVFDVMKTEKGKPFLPAEHWKKLSAYAKQLNLQVPIQKEKYFAVLKKLLTLNKFSKATIRTVLTGGKSPNGFEREEGKETFIILIEKFHGIAKEVYEKGAAIITEEYERFYPQTKTVNYVIAVRNQERKVKAKAMEILYLKNGQVLEASTSNFFLVKNGKIITQKKNVLLGITRNIVVEMARKNKFKVEEREILEKELWQAQEAFMTATSKDIVPVTKIDGKKVEDGKVGEIAKILMKEFQKFVREY